MSISSRMSYRTAGVSVLTALALAGCSSGSHKTDANSLSASVSTPSSPSSSSSSSTSMSSSTSSSAPTSLTGSAAPTSATPTPGDTGAAGQGSGAQNLTGGGGNAGGAKPTGGAAGAGLTKDGFAIGGPAYPAHPANRSQPSPKECARFNTQLHSWATYQNQHRPARYAKVPASSDRKYLALYCDVDYDAAN